MELEKLSALELGELVNSKQVKPTEVISYFTGRIDSRNPSINAFVYTRIDYAMEKARKQEDRIMKDCNEGPLAGVPFILKDFLPSKKGWTATHGGVKCYQTIDHVTSAFTRAAESLGAIAVGKANAPSFGFRATTDNKMYGPTSTPFKPGYNSGGSSGGSASAVADGLVQLGEAGDAGGSIRVPAAWCGVFGFKPSAGVVPSVCRPDAWTATHPYCCPGPVTRTVADAKVIFNAMRGYNPKDPISVPSLLDSTVRPLRIGYTLDFNLFPIPDKEIVKVTEDVVNLLRSTKHSSIECVDLVAFDFKYSKQDMEYAWLRGISIDDAMNEHVQHLIEEHPEDFPEAVIKWTSIARKSTMEDYIKFHEIRTDILDAHLNVFDHYDIILAPVTGCLPVKNSDDGDTKGPSVISGEEVDPLIGFAYTYLENMTGMPAASIPIGLSKEGLPIGLQVIAPRYKDMDVFRLCEMLEQLRPWSYDIPFRREI